MFIRAELQTPEPNQLPLAQIFEAMPVAILVANSDGIIEMVNSALERMFRASRSDLLGATVESLMPASQRVAHRDLVRQYLEHPAHRLLGAGRDLDGLRKDGQVFPIEVGLSPLPSQGEVKIVATIIDRTERQDRQRNLELVFQTAPCGMLLVDSSGLITMANPEVLRLFGYTEDELVGAPIESLVPQRSHEKHPALRQAYVNDPHPRRMGRGRDLTGRHKSGAEFPIEIGLSAIATEKGPQSLAAVIDISHRKQAEMALRLANTNLEEFTYVASHDLKSPLRAMADLLSWIEESIEADDMAAARNNIARAHLRIALLERIIEDLLTFARAGIVFTDSTLISVPDLIAQAVEVQHLPPGFIISIDCPDLSIIAPKAPLNTALRNLIGNAIKHRARDDGRVCIKVAESDAFIVFTVADDGPGVPKAARTRIFKLFQTATSNSAGGGIGLAVSKRMIEGHGGELELLADDDVGGTIRGATFRLRWPRFIRRANSAL